MAGRLPERGDVYSINPNPIQGREMEGRHNWLVLTPSAINRHGMVMVVAISTGAQGMRAAGLTMPITAGNVTGVAVLNQVRSFDIRERVGLRDASYVATAPKAVVDDIGERIATMVSPDEPELPARTPGQGGAKDAGVGTLGAALIEALAADEARRTKPDDE